MQKSDVSSLAVEKGVDKCGQRRRKRQLDFFLPLSPAKHALCICDNTLSFYPPVLNSQHVCVCL